MSSPIRIIFYISATATYDTIEITIHYKTTDEPRTFDNVMVIESGGEDLYLCTTEEEYTFEDAYVAYAIDHEL